jgi:antitoxin (DNA-binding transcriptional repressor) of toxin-antitoxin stability system
MMRTATVRQLRTETSALMRGREPVIITSHGKPASLLLNLEGEPRNDLERLAKRQMFIEMMKPIWKKLDGVTEKELEDDFKTWRKSQHRSR